MYVYYQNLHLIPFYYIIYPYSFLLFLIELYVPNRTIFS